MITSIFYAVLTLIAFSFIIFIHELGHYIIGKREGMKIEVFSIGMGKPLFSWMYQGVRWQFCPLLFGGYVKFAGMERRGNVEPHQVKGGFFAAKPWSRIRVLVAGPLINILFALVAFCIVYFAGGRIVKFAEHTQLIGVVDDQSKAYKKKIRAGDRIETVNDAPYRGYEQLLYTAILNKGPVTFSGEHLDYFNKKTTPFVLRLKPYSNSKMPLGIQSFGFLAPASYLIYTPDLLKKEDLETLPIHHSGIEKGDRVVWANGQLLFSQHTLSSAINNQYYLMTVKRGNKTFLTRVPKVLIRDLRLNQEQRSELNDWQYELEKRSNLDQLYFIPYDINARCIVQKPLTYISPSLRETNVYNSLISNKDTILKKGDKILAVNSIPVSRGYHLLSEAQTPKALIVVQRGMQYPLQSWTKEDDRFIHSINFSDLNALISAVGQPQKSISKVGNLVMLKPIQPVKYAELLGKTSKQAYENKLKEQKEKISKIQNQAEKTDLESQLRDQESRLFVGLPVKDVKVIYNPNPITMFYEELSKAVRTMGTLLSGQLHHKWLSGPLGMATMVHHHFYLGFNQALYFIGYISLGLGIINLLPIPGLDGGYICFALYESMSGRRIHSKLMERLIIPFIIAIFGLFIFFTYRDFMRLLFGF